MNEFLELLHENDYLAQMAFQWKEGYKEGFKEGYREGRKESKIKIATNLRRMGMSMEQIIEYTGLTEEQIEAL